VQEYPNKKKILINTNEMPTLKNKNGCAFDKSEEKFTVFNIKIYDCSKT